MAIKEATLPVGTTDKLLDTTEITQEDGTKAHREAVFIADPVDTRRRANVVRTRRSLLKTDVRNTYAVATADAQARRTASTLEAILDQLQVMNMHLESMSE